MVLSRRHRGGAGSTGASRRRDGEHGSEHGSQTLEFALTVPAIVLLLVVLVHAALFGADLVVAHGMAREAARVAAVDDDGSARAAVRAAVGRRPVRVTFTPPDGRREPGDSVRARLELRSRGFAPFGVRLWLPAEATMRVEGG